MNENHLKKIRRAKFMFLQKKPFWSGILTIPCEVSDETEVAATDGKRIILNGKYLSKVTPNDLVLDLAHEYLHILLGHVADSRFKIATNDVEWQIANMAADYVVNAIIKEEFMRIQPTMLYNEKFVSKTFEQVYKELMKKFRGSIGQSVSRSGTPQSQNSRKRNKDGTGDIDNDETQKRLQGHKIWKSVKGENSLQQRLKQSLLRSYLQGNLPAGLRREVIDMLHPPLPISEIISSFVLERSYSKRNWKRLNKRRYPPIIYPQIKGRCRLQICAAIDTSGSIDTELLSEFKAGMQFLFSYFREDLNVLLIQCDAKVQAKHWIRSPEDLNNIEWKGGGGTDFRPVFREIEKYPELRGLIYITDTFGTPPSKPPLYPVVWLVPESLRDSHRKLPFGRTVFYEGGKGRSV